MQVSVIIPVFNEEEIISNTITEVVKVLQRYKSWELIIVDDGSTDQTLELAAKKAFKNPRIQIVSYQPNHGRGRALRKGFAKATGDIVVTLDADLSFDETHIPKLVNELLTYPDIDIVVGSPYMKDGEVRGVSPHSYREVLSRAGNLFLRYVFPGKLTTFTGILRAYRQPILNAIELESDGKEIHLEILSKALAIGAHVKEIPAISTLRKKGKSKTRIRATIASHIIFSVFEKPALLFVIAGFLLLLAGSGIGIYAIAIRESLNPTRPMITLMVLLILVGIQTLFFGFIARQIVILRKEIYRVQKENLELKKETQSIQGAIIDRINLKR